MKTSTDIVLTERGWGNPSSSKKWHYFVQGDSRSLCGKWAYLGPREEGNDGSPDNCAECKKRKAKMSKV